MSGWIGVDLDGTLARYDGKFVNGMIGEPIPKMVAHVKQWLAEGKDVRIFTARVAFEGGVWTADSLGHAQESLAQSERAAIEAWCLEHIGKVLPVTAKKDFGCEAIYDDRAWSVEFNSGLIFHEYAELIARQQIEELTRKIVAVIEARRMKVLTDRQDPSYTEHFAELQNEVRDLAKVYD